LDAKRDWGFAGDYVEAMWLMLQQDEPDDYVIATGMQNTIGELLSIGFNHVGIPDWKQYIESDARFKRPADLFSLCGDSTKAQTKLGWKPRTSFEEMVKSMVDADLRRNKNV
jgi:GDPmannose 4,6-dehydratase